MTETTSPSAGALLALLEPDRLAFLTDSGLLSGRADESLDAAARLIASLLDAPVAFVSVVGADRQVLPGAVRRDAPDDDRRVMRLSESFCQFAVATGEPLIVSDAPDTALVSRLDTVTRREIGAYAGHPLRTRDGHLLGTLCVIDRTPREWTAQELRVLADLTRLTAAAIELRAEARQLSWLRRCAALTAEELDDVTSELTALIFPAPSGPAWWGPGAVAHRDAPLSALSRVAVSLREAAAPVSAVSRPGIQPVDLAAVLQKTVDTTRTATGGASISVDADSSLFVRCDPLEVERCVTHLLVKTLLHSAVPADVQLRLVGNTSENLRRPAAELTVTATGSSVPAAALQSLVDDFHATTCDESTPEPGRPARASASGPPQGARVSSGDVEANTGGAGLRFRARWTLASVPAGGPPPCTG